MLYGHRDNSCAHRTGYQYCDFRTDLGRGATATTQLRPRSTHSIQRTVRDSDDDIVLATALAAQAKIIVSGDNDLLVLHSFQHIHILNAADALHHIQTHMTDKER